MTENLCTVQLLKSTILRVPLSHRELYWTDRRYLDGPSGREMAASLAVKSVTDALYRLPSLDITAELL